MRLVETKDPEQQEAQVLHRARKTLMRHRTKLANTIRAHMAELGLATAPTSRRRMFKSTLPTGAVQTWPTDRTITIVAAP